MVIKNLCYDITHNKEPRSKVDNVFISGYNERW